MFQIRPNIPVKDKVVSGICIVVPIDNRYLQRIFFLRNNIYCLVFIKGNVYKIPKKWSLHIYYQAGSFGLHKNFCCRSNIINKDCPAYKMRLVTIPISIMVPDFYCIYNSLFHVGWQEECFNKVLKTDCKIKIYTIAFTSLTGTLSAWAPFRVNFLKKKFLTFLTIRF